eukprot:5790058-Amphidinium_carterae.1
MLRSLASQLQSILAQHLRKYCKMLSPTNKSKSHPCLPCSDSRSTPIRCIPYQYPVRTTMHTKLRGVNHPSPHPAHLQCHHPARSYKHRVSWLGL